MQWFTMEDARQSQPIPHVMPEVEKASLKGRAQRQPTRIRRSRVTVMRSGLRYL